MLPITSSKNPIVKLVKSLADKKSRKETGLFVAEGLAMLERAMAMGWKPEHFVSTKPQFIWDDIKPSLVTDKLMAELSALNNPQDVLAVFRHRFQPHPTRTGTWLALEEIRDPGNLGTIIRTADAAGADGIILVGDCCDPFSPDCVRATTGSIFAVPLVKMNAGGFLDLMKAWPGETIGTSGQATLSYRRTYSQPALLLLGNEGRGLSQALTSACNTLVKIPMREGVESLNIAVAAALMIYEIEAITIT
jgi:RNA methyltransferase, TrmH family